MKARLNLSDIRAAQSRIAGKAMRTPVFSNDALDDASGATLFFKAENLQKIGAFKARGAANIVFSLGDEARAGVVTHSSGNFGAAVAWAARLRGIPAYVVMPSNSPLSKQRNVKRYGADVILCEPTLQAREDGAAEVIARTGAVFLHSYNDLRVMAGQGTAALELLEQAPDLDMLLCPVGGGGLLSGVAVAAKGMRPSIEVVAVEPEGADDARRSFEAKKLIPVGVTNTIADGLLTSLGAAPFAEILDHVSRVVTVPDAAIIAAMRQLWEELKLVVEPSGAVAYAAIPNGRVDVRGKRVGIILSGGNLDLDTLPWMHKP